MKQGKDRWAYNGHYWITRDGNEQPYPAYCDMVNGGLELGFKEVGNIGGHAYALWQDTSLDYNATTDINTFRSNNHYVSSRLQSTWDSAGDNFNSITARMLNGSQEEAQLTFDPSDSDYISWFSADYYLTDSTWSDLKSSDSNYFSIAGHHDVQRNFLVNSNCGGCEVDKDWMVLTGRDDECDWEEQRNYINIMFAPYGTALESDGGDDGWQFADTFTLYADYDHVYGSCREALEQTDFRA